MHRSSFEPQITQVIIVTGLSGAGKNVVMRALEDLSFYCVDNLPVPLISTFLKFAFQSQDSLIKIALGLDVRGKRFAKDFMREIDQVKKNNQDRVFKIIFLNSSDNTLVKRFQETRRSHPLAKGLSVVDAIKSEQQLLKPVRDMADIVLDTDNLNIHELRRWVRNSFGDNNRKLVVNLISFGFKYGIPTESNITFDVRFLPNPFFIPALKAYDGREKIIQEYLFNQEEVVDYWLRVKDFISHTITKYYKEGHSFVNIAIGCTGGKHRSVSFIEKLSGEVFDDVVFLTHHRDINK